MRQITFACQPSFEKYVPVSRGEQFLNTMEAVVPWTELEALIEPHYPKAGKGHHPVALGTMLRIYFFAALVQPVGPRRRGCALRIARTARRCRRRPGEDGSAGRDYHPELPPSG